VSDATLGQRFAEWSRREPGDIDGKAAGRVTGSERVKRPTISPCSVLSRISPISKEGVRFTSRVVIKNPAYAK